ncbi:hypothetical protein CQW23_13573 [Capsicum baccatum]|uniref:Ubiquitin-like protease family profile domain-containing protein n=1 Tax=Capsicum baccatum TaxID=33114 RepID=A0A2G2WGP2_CAPBA|nr:hypothetical protein CQW23_13573 [Capsicum baccatum]
MLELEQGDPDEIPVYLQGTILKFTISEFALISGLKCNGNIEEHLYTRSSKSVLMAKYFSSSKHTVKKFTFVQRFKEGNFDNNTDALNLSILYFIHTFWFSQVRDTTISRSDFVMVEDGSTIAEPVDNVIPRIFNWKVVRIKVRYEKFMAGLTAPVDDISLEVVKPVDETVNLHSLSDSQIPSNYPNSVVAAHLAAKTPAKRTRTRSRIFKSPYTTDFAYGSKALEDESTNFKQTFAFEGYGISDDMPSSIIEEYKKWVLESLLKFHSQKKMNDEHYKAKASSLGVQQYNFVVAYARSKNWFYLMSQKNSCWNDENLRKKSKLRTGQEYRFTTTNFFFKNYVEKTYRRYYPNDSDTVISTQQDYVESVVMAYNENAVNNIIKGFLIPVGLPWNLVDKVYVPINCNQNFHWALVVIALKNRRIRVYNSLSNLINMDSSPEIHKLAVMLPTFLSDSEFFEQTSRTDWPNLDAYRDKMNDTMQLLNTNPFEVEYVQNITQQDCDSLNYGLQKAKKDYVSENEDPPRPSPRLIKHSIPDEMAIVRIG